MPDKSNKNQPDVPLIPILTVVLLSLVVKLNAPRTKSLDEKADWYKSVNATEVKQRPIIYPAKSILKTLRVSGLGHTRIPVYKGNQAKTAVSFNSPAVNSTFMRVVTFNFCCCFNESLSSFHDLYGECSLLCCTTVLHYTERCSYYLVHPNW